MKTIEINGLKWDVENLKVGDKEYFTFDGSYFDTRSKDYSVRCVY